MNEFEVKVQRTWVQLLVDHDFKEVAAIAIDTDINLRKARREVWNEAGTDTSWEEYIAQVAFLIPTSAFTYVRDNKNIQNVMERAIKTIVGGQLYRFSRYDGAYINADELGFVYNVSLINVEDDWKDTVRSLIATSGLSNQGTITEKIFAREKRQHFTYNEMKFASQSEIRIAQEFELRKVLFFPLPLAVRAETGSFYRDHREVDFLVCDNGIWGILEVSYHPDRYEKDAEKDVWFKQSGILCIQHYPAERCYNDAGGVVEEFLSILARYKR